MPTVLVLGAAGVIGTRVVEFLRQAGFGVTVAEISGDEPGLPADGVSAEEVVADGVVAAVHLRLGSEQDGQRVQNLLSVLSTAGVRHMTLVSSASVYGAWPDNPIPLLEDAPVRPNPETPFAVRHAAAERAVQQWTGDIAGGTTGNTAAILRPAPVVSSPIGGPIGEAMLATAPIRTGRDDPPAQFLHLDDLASAVVLAVSEQLSGVFNVAPNGWLTAAELRALLGARPKVRLPLALPHRLDRFVARRVSHEAPSGILAYTRYPWVIANDRLSAAGWTPRYGNDLAFVHADAGMPWDDLNARQRQHVSLALSVAAALAVSVGAALWARRRILLRHRARHNLDRHGGRTGFRV